MTDIFGQWNLWLDSRGQHRRYSVSHYWIGLCDDQDNNYDVAGLLLAQCAREAANIRIIIINQAPSVNIHTTNQLD